MADTSQRLAERLIQEGEKVCAFCTGLSPQQWEVQVYSEGSCWTVRQIVAHFDITETNICWLIRDILAGGSGAPPNFELDAFNERTVAARQNLSSGELVSNFAAHRLKTVELVRQMSAEDLAKVGRHPFLGLAPLADVIKLMYLHNQTHLRYIRRLLS